MPGPIGREISPGHRVVSASMLPDSITECPHCGSKNFTITGDFHRVFEQIFEDSKVKDGGMSLGGQAVQTVEGLVCPACNTHTIIEDDSDFERDSLIFDLTTQIAILQGKVPPPPGKEWKN